MERRVIVDDSRRTEAEKRLYKIRYSKETEAYIREFCGCEQLTFADYLNHVMASKGIKTADVLKNSGVNRNYGYNIINGIRSNPSSDKVIALCIGARMNLQEMQSALDIAGKGRLLYFDERDVRIAAAVNSDIYKVVEINMILSEHNLRLIDN